MTNRKTAEPLLAGHFDVRGRRRYAIDAGDWQPMKIGDTVLPGFSWIPLADDEQDAWSSYWMRLAPGACSPMHRHEATELLLVLEGVFTDDDGTDYGAGETVTYSAGSTHSSSSVQGCVVLVVTRIGSTIAR